MSLSTPITGSSYVIANQTTQLANSTAGGTWSSSDNSLATVGTEGLVTGVAEGLVVIKYDIVGDFAVFSLNVQPYQLTNGFNLQQIMAVASTRLTWKSQGNSDSGRYYQDFHSLNDENLIKNLQPTINPTSPEFAEILSSLNRSVILDALNDTYNHKQVIDSAKLIFNRYGYDRLFLQTIINQGQFVGLSFNIAEGDFAVAFKKLLLFFNTACTFNMYLYNDMIDLPIATFPVTVKANSQTVIPVTGFMNLLLNYIPAVGDQIGGRWFLGYYQDDIEALGCQALFFNITYQRFKVIAPLAFSAPVISDINDSNIRNFNRTNVGANNLMYGCNAELVSYIDPTVQIINFLGNGLFDNLFGKMMTAKIIEMIIFSYRNNKVQVNIQGNDLLDKLYFELNAAESSNPTELNFSNGLRKQIEDAKRVVKQGFQDKKRTFIGCG